MINTVKVSVGDEYVVSIGTGILDRVADAVDSLKKVKRVFIVTDSNVEKLYLEKCTEILTSRGFAVFSFVFPAGEQSKNINTFSGILESMANAGLDRNDCAVALGGGVVGDITGFAAGCYMRGIPFVQVPTTLLAAVDSSVGGKTAIDLNSGKNLAGLFNQPVAVVCDTNCLETLPESELSCGFAEVIKTAVLAGEKEFVAVENSESENIGEIITDCVEYKKGVVERDEKEHGERKLLNLGHTVGHAIEKLSGYTIPHGFAVAAGLAIITRYAANTGKCDRVQAKRIIGAVKAKGLPIDTEFSDRQLARAALNDKKRTANEITLVVPYGIGDCRLETVSVDSLYDIIAKGTEEIL